MEKTCTTEIATQILNSFYLLVVYLKKILLKSEKTVRKKKQSKHLN